MEESAFGRIASVLFAPAKTFASIARRPTWGVALLVFLVLSLAVVCVVTPRVDMGEMIRASVEESGRELPAEQLDGMIDFMEKFQWPMAIGSVVVFQPAFYLLIALVFWVGLKLLGGELSYKTSLSVALHSLAPRAVAALLTIPVVLSRQSLDYGDVQTGSFLASNLGALAPEGAGPGLKVLLASVDVFSLWSLVLMVMGYQIAAKVSRGSAIGVVVGLWVLAILAWAGLASLRG